MDVFLCGEWDGSHLWLQWEPSSWAQSGYEVRVAQRGPDAWQNWQPSMITEQAWLVHATQQGVGAEFRAEVRARVVGEEQWHRAREVTFVRSHCRFEIKSGQRDLHYLEGTIFHRHVDGAACAYELTEEIEIPAGESREVILQAVASGGYSQLDQPNDFMLRPALGVVIRNLEASTHDVQETGRDYTQLAVMKRDGPVTLAFLETPLVQ